MDGKDNISYYRNKLDKTLTSSDLTNDDILRTLVKNQLLQSPHVTQPEGYTENVLERRSKEVSSFLGMLRSASENDHERSKSSEEPTKTWKVKQDSEDVRVMYREGPEGTPFHSLLVEGYVDGPLDVCLCISVESGLYQKWWPQNAIPTFKVVSSRCLKRVRIGEQISLVRMKLSWPLSSREALIHYFVFEYFQDDLTVVLLNSISDSEAIDRDTHGFTRDGIPDVEDVVRIDVVGGFALQKVSADRSFFRTIANMDIKLDFVPPAMINFISRQLVGSGFKLYKKEVGLVAKGDQKFLEALKDPLYTRIREALYSENISIETSPDIETTQVLEDSDEEISIETSPDTETTQVLEDIDEEVEDVIVVRDRKEPVVEIEECESSNYLNNEIKEKIEADEEELVISTKGEQQEEPLRIATENIGYNTMNMSMISPKVQQALETLEKAISMFRGYRSDHPETCVSDIDKGNLEKDSVVEGTMLSHEAKRMSEMNGNVAVSWKINEPVNSSDSDALRYKESTSDSCIKETNQSKIVPAHEEEQQQSSPPADTKHIILVHSSSSMDHGSIVPKKNKRKSSRYCCFHFVSVY